MSSFTHKRQKYTTRACDYCRLRKIRCDGVRPTCKACGHLEQSCVYSDRRDARRAPAKDYVKALEERVKLLEDILESRMGSDGSMRSVSIRDVEDEELSQSSDEGSVDDADVVVEQLQYDNESGEYRYFGPPSAFHLFTNSSTDPSHPQAASRHPDTPPLLPPDGSSQDWRRHLPQLPTLSRQLHDTLISRCLCSIGFYQIVDEATFCRDMHLCLSDANLSAPLRTSSYSPLVHTTLLLCGCDCVDDPFARDESNRLALENAANAHLTAEAEKPKLSTIHGAVLLGQYFTTDKRHGLAYIYTGMAIRMSRTLGLGADCTPYVLSGAMSEATQIARIRTYWVCQLYDKLWSHYIGHAPTLVLSKSIGLPEIMTEKDEEMWGSWLRGKSVRCYGDSSFHWTCRMVILVEEILQAIYSVGTHIYRSSVLNKVSALGVELENWWRELPDPLRVSPATRKPRSGAVLSLNAYYLYAVILLYRPYYVRRHSTTDSSITALAVRRCNAAAKGISALFKMYDTMWDLATAPILWIQFSFAACTTSLLLTAHASESEAQAGLTMTEDIIALIRRLGPPFKTSLEYADMLSSMLMEWTPAVVTSVPDSTGMDVSPRAVGAGVAPVASSSFIGSTDPFLGVSSITPMSTPSYLPSIRPDIRDRIVSPAYNIADYLRGSESPGLREEEAGPNDAWFV